MPGLTEYLYGNKTCKVQPDNLLYIYNVLPGTGQRTRAGCREAVKLPLSVWRGVSVRSGSKGGRGGELALIRKRRSQRLGVTHCTRAAPVGAHLQFPR